MWALVPLKILDQVKSRLAPVLTAEERRGLVLAMLKDVLQVLCQSQELSGVLLVSREPHIKSLLPDHATLNFWQEPVGCDLSQTITAASNYLATTFQATGVMIVPADVPLISRADIQQLLRRHNKVSLVADHQSRGTNCLICSPPNNMPVLYDGQSFKPHLKTARNLGLHPLIAKADSLSLDIDTPEDLVHLIYRVDKSHTRQFINNAGIASRVLAHQNKTLTG
ncbi:MAG: 2-phospho-L-lactate guanylyltransferase [Pseudomonadales bacterium]|nr:2-phospho-L-lactate guanylyltransferase [Pseudomonadales bacterium]